MGNNADLVLSLAVKSTRLDGFPYLPVQSASWAGLHANVRMQNAKSTVLTYESEASLIETTLGESSAEPGSLVQAESETIET